MPDGRYRIGPGRDKAWRELAAADPAAVAAGSLARFDGSTGDYYLEVLGREYRIDTAGGNIEDTADPQRTPEYLLGLSIPVYLTNARPVPVSGELVKDLPGGEFFFRGSHTLPLDAVASRYRQDADGFLDAGMSLGGRRAGHGDASFSFNAFPRVSMTFVLWVADEEFDARADLLFDSNAGRHMALDVVWAVALVACQRVLKFNA